MAATLCRVLLIRESVGKVVFRVPLLRQTWLKVHSPRISIKKNLAGGTGLTLAALWASKAPQNKLPEEADLLYKSNKHRETIALLSGHKESRDVELLWRLCRAQYNLSLSDSVSPQEKTALVQEGFQVISHAMAVNPEHWAVHKWMSVLLDAKSALQGIKVRISNLETVKKHMMKAIQLNPSDATTLHMLGVWCYEIADMPWYQRKIASTLFATPPTSSYQEALEYFIKAEQVEPNFYSKNLLLLAKTYAKLNENQLAVEFMTRASLYSPNSEEDSKVVQEAKSLLAHMKP